MDAHVYQNTVAAVAGHKTYLRNEHPRRKKIELSFSERKAAPTPDRQIHNRSVAVTAPTRQDSLPFLVLTNNNKAIERGPWLGGKKVFS